MPSPCEGCALTRGAAANCEPHNHVKAMIAVLAPSPFYCHAPMDWQENITHYYPPRLLKKLGQLKVCEGWRREVAALAATGYYKEDADLTRLVGAAAMLALRNFLREDATPAERERARVELNAYFGMLVEKKSKFIRGRAAALAEGGGDDESDE